MKKAIGIIVLVVLIGAGVYAFGFAEDLPFDLPGSEASVSVDVPDDAWSKGANVDKVVKKAGSKGYSQTYKNSEYQFSFKYPEGFKIGEVPHGEDGNTIVVQNAEDSVGFQVYVTPYGGADTAITKAKIEADIPDMKVKQPQPVAIGSSGKGLAFISENSNFGESREVWFVFNGHLYQISTYLSQDKLLQRVLNSWKFGA